MNNIKLEDCKLITNLEYTNLDNPEFIGQTKLDQYNGYHMIWKSNNILYKTYNILD